MEKNNSKTSTIIIVVLLILLMGVSGYVVYDKTLSNKNENNNVENKNNVNNVETNNNESNNNQTSQNDICPKVERLKDVSKISSAEKNEIYSVLDKYTFDKPYVKYDKDSVQIFMINPYVYSVNYDIVTNDGQANSEYSYFYKADGKWNSERMGHSSTKDIEFDFLDELCVTNVKENINDLVSIELKYYNSDLKEVSKKILKKDDLINSKVILGILDFKEETTVPDGMGASASLTLNYSTGNVEIEFYNNNLVHIDDSRNNSKNYYNLTYSSNVEKNITDLFK